jgi:hypothetical protein
MAYKLAVDLIIINFYNPKTHQQATMNTNNQRMAFAKKMDKQMQLPNQRFPALQRSPSQMSSELKRLIHNFTRRQVIQ